MASDSPPYQTYETPPLDGPDGPVEKIAIVGYGNQGRAQALNLRDSGLPVIVGLRDGSPRRKVAAEDGLEVDDIAGASKRATAIFILVPDEFTHEAAEIVQEHAHQGAILILAHGASIHFGYWKPADGLDCGLIAPHGPGLEVRRLYAEGGGIPALLAVVQDATGRCRERLKLLAAALGCARPGGGIRWSNLKEEVETDLFVEQALLVGGVVELLRAVISTLVRAGYDPAICRMSTIYELMHITNVYNNIGPLKTFKAISPTAAFGAATRGQRLLDEHSRRILDDILEEIQNGTFVEELVSPEAPLILEEYIAELEKSHLSEADKPFHE